MKKLFTLLVITLATYFSVSAQVDEDFETLTSGSKLVLDGWINYAEAGTIYCKGYKYNNDLFAYFNPYGTSSTSNIMWLITPGVNLNASTKDSLKFVLSYGYFSTNTTPLAIKYSTDFNGTESGIASATWNDITNLCNIPTKDEVTSTFTPFKSTAISLEAYSGTIYVAFIYTGGSGATTAVELDDVVVGDPSPESKITSFTVPNQLLDSDIDAENSTVSLTVYPGTDVTALVPEIELSEGASASPAIGSAQNFTNPVTYTVTSSDGASVTKWTVTVNILSSTPTSIYSLQYVSDPATSDASLYAGKPIFTTGVVTYGSGSGSAYIQSAAGLWNGIYVYVSSSKTNISLSKGDSVLLYGTISEYKNLTEFVPDSVYTVSDRKSLKATTVTAPLTESMEGVLVEVDNLLIQDKGDGDYYGINTSSDSIIIDNYLYSGLSLTVGSRYNISGVVNSYYNTYSIYPRSSSDIADKSSVNSLAKNGLLVYPNPVSDVLYVENANSEKVQIINIYGQIVKKLTISNKSIDVSDLNKGVYLLSVGSKITRFVKE